MNLYIDIETLPTERPEIAQMLSKDISAPGNYKKQESIDKWLEENYEKEVEDRVRKTSLSGDFGQILAIGFAIDEEPVSVLYREDEWITEESLLDYFFRILQTELGDREHKTITWIGHNIGGFDLRYLQKRCVVNGVNPKPAIPYNKSLFSGDFFDTMYEWAGLKDRISQDNLCLALGLPTKPGMTGADVFDYWRAGKHQEIKDYCRHDVESVRRIHKKLTFKEI